MKCLFHRWKGCRCVVCGAKNMNRHQWETFSCGQRCTVCGQERSTSHDWDKKCGERTCIKCGKTENAGHHWESIVHHHPNPHPDTYTSGCKCLFCDKLNPTGEHHWETKSEGGLNIVYCRVCGFIKEKLTPEEEQDRMYEQMTR